MAPGNPLWMASAPGASVPAGVAAHAGVDLWVARDGSCWRAYASGAKPVVAGGWIALEPLAEIAGTSSQRAAPCHYVVETNVPEQCLDEFNAWYEMEHLPGLASVPGVVRARRYRRSEGTPLYVACYDLLGPEVMERPEWLAVRGTPWSSRVRRMFHGTVRTFFVRPDPADA
jgi:hypothetical protein